MYFGHGGGGGGWWHFMRYDEDQGQPDVTRMLLRRVYSYAQPYRRQIFFVLAAIALTSIIQLAPPLIYRRLIDTTLPGRDLVELNWLAVAMITVPLLTGLIGVAQRYASARMGEGLICDLRQALYDHVHRMSLRFFTHTKPVEILARLNNDVVGAQRAIPGPLRNIVPNIIPFVPAAPLMGS